MTGPTKRSRIAVDRWLPIVGLILFLAGAGWMVWGELLRPERTYWLKATGGRRPGPRERVARILATEVSRRGVQLELVECSGSVEALDLVDSGKVRVALVQGGLDSRHWTHVRQIAALHVEPLQLVVRGDLAIAVAGNLASLRDKSINVGEPGSGSNALAREVLGFVGLKDRDYRASTLSHEQIQDIPSADQLPDAVMTVGSLPTPIVRQLVERWGYRLIPLEFAEAFALGDLFGDDASIVDPSGNRVLVNKVHIHPTTIPACTYGVQPPVPGAALDTFGSRVLVVTHEDTSPEAVKRILETIFLGDFAQIARPPLDASLLDLPTEFPPHPGTLAFQQRNKPLIFGDLLEVLEKTLSISSVVIGAAFFAWQGAKRNYRRRRELGFESYLLKVTAIERRALELELAARLDLGALLAKQAELGQIKDEALRRFTLGELEGEGLMSGFLTHANDARDYLARLILHTRTQVEKRARRKGLSVEAAWDHALGKPDPPIEEARDLPTEAPVL